MTLKATALLLIFNLGLAVSALSTFFGNRLVEELEHLLVDNAGYNNGNFTFGITPCGFYFQGPQTTGRDTAGQWMRVGFHDFATANVAAGTGGLDASIGYETLRPENSGTAMNDSLSFFAPFVNNHASMADMIALGTTLAVKVCSGPLIPFKGGRIDATEGGEFGVPEPDTPIDVTLAQFAHAGFSQTEAIQLTACGHTVGRVHNAGFPTVVGPEAKSENNTQGGVDMDDTFNVYDNHISVGYLDGTTTNPLVTSFNVSSRSDLRIFSSDLNATMQDLATSNDHFQDVCVQVVSKQLNTVPSNVILQDIKPISVKPTNLQVSLSSSGQITLTGDIRLLGTDFVANPTRRVIVKYFTRSSSFSGSVTTEPLTEATTGASQYTGSALFFYPFTISVPPAIGLSSFTVHVQENAEESAQVFDNSGKKFGVQDTAFWLKDLTSTKVDSATNVATISVTAAVRKDFAATNVHAAFHVPVVQIGTYNPLITTFVVNMTRTTGSPSSLISLYTGSIDITTLNATAQKTTMDIVASSAKETVTDDFRKLGTLSWS